MPSDDIPLVAKSRNVLPTRSGGEEGHRRCRAHPHEDAMCDVPEVFEHHV
jgi:hypothetical protein